jgi:hypothetical protein
MNDRITIGIAAVLLSASLAAAGAIAGVVQRQRSDLQLVVTMEGVEGMPPHVAIVTAALGTFRGLAVDLLWARADHLQTEGEFYEAQTLSQWITTLQPRFQKVWAFQAWNLSYNIAAATQVPAERWGWVNRGINLLRSQGIPLNPRAVNLYFDLAWIFQNKIGRVGDPQHWYYKARLATEMQEVLGDLTGGKTTAESLERFRIISSASDTLDELTRRHPGVVRAIGLLAAHGAKPDEATLRMLGRVLMHNASLDARLLGFDKLPPGTNVELLKAMRADRETSAEIVDHLVPYLQRRVLADRYRMDPGEMYLVMERYGPLDWRHALSHGIYWSEKGLKVSQQLSRREDVNELMLVRGRLMMLLDLMRSGRVELDTVTNRVDLLPDPRFARSYEAAALEAFDLIASERGVSAAEFGSAEESDLLDGYEKFLNLATTLAYFYGDRSEAERYFTKLREVAAGRGFGDEPAYTDTLENFVAIRFAGLVQVNLADLRQFLDAMIRRGLVEGLARGNLEVFNRYLRVAHSVYDRRFASSTPNEKYVREDVRLVEFPKLVDNSFENVMKQASMPVLERARIWAWAPETLRTNSYQALVETLHSQAEAAGIDPERAFPSPAASKPDSAEGSPADAAATPSGTEADDGGA